RREPRATADPHAPRSTAVTRPMVTGILKRLPARQGAYTIPTDVTNFDLVIRDLAELGSQEVTTLWFTRVREARPHDVRACDWLFRLSIQTRDLRAAEHASAQCTAHALDQESRVALAALLLEHGRYADAARAVRDVSEWQGRGDLRVRAWL